MRTVFSGLRTGKGDLQSLTVARCSCSPLNRNMALHSVSPLKIFFEREPRSYGCGILWWVRVSFVGRVFGLFFVYKFVYVVYSFRI